MSTGLFLWIVVAALVTGLAYEVYAWVTGNARTISYLAYHHPILRWAILGAIVLFGIWWTQHSSLPASR